MKTSGRNYFREAVVRWILSAVFLAAITTILWVTAEWLRPIPIEFRYKCRILQVNANSILVSTRHETFEIRRIMNLDKYREYFADLSKRKANIALKLWKFPDQKIEILEVDEFFNFRAAATTGALFFVIKKRPVGRE